MIFSCVFRLTALAFFAFTSGSVAAKRPFFFSTGFGASGLSSTPVPFAASADSVPAEDITAPGAATVFVGLPVSVPTATSSVPAGIAVRGACPKRIFSRFTFFAALPFFAATGVITARPVFGSTAGVRASTPVTVRVPVVSGEATTVFLAATVCSRPPAAPGLRSNRVVCFTFFFFTGGGAYAVYSVRFSFAVAPESVKPGASST